MKKIKAIINKKTGAVTISTEGFDGAECLEATRALEEGLGLRDAPKEFTPEYYNENTQRQELGGS